LTPCAGGTICASLPLVNKPGTVSPSSIIGHHKHHR
jgi:hypothetical protein